MLLQRAAEEDYPEIIDLANLAYRGTGPSASWNAETGILDGQRLDESLLRDDVDNKPDGRLLILRDEDDRTLLGCVWLEPTVDNVWYLGLLAVRPDQQKRHLGGTLLAAAEDFARNHGAQRIKMSVLMVRDTLIAWYLRRGYALTGETRPFPYGDDRFGRPLRDDLYFVVLEKPI